MRVLNVDYRSNQAQALFTQSLKDTGFAVLNNHPITPSLVNNAYAAWQDFFYSGDNKFAYLTQKPGQDGYFPLLSENAKDRNVSDLKEFFHFYPAGKIPPELKAISLEMYNALSVLASELLQWIENCLPANVSKQLNEPLKNMIINSPNTLLRILHYPPIEGDIEPGAERAAAHEDINLITLLPAATAPGLEVQDVNNNWHAVTCDPGNIVVNVGDMLQMCTQHYFKSTTHRVVNPLLPEGNQSRFSMPLFLHPRDEVQLSDNYSAFEYKFERLRQIGIY